MSRKRKLCRPPKNAVEVERLAVNGRWVKDDGKPGLAFSGKDPRHFPFAWYPREEGDSIFDHRAPSRRAIDRTSERFSCANGRVVPTLRRT